MSILDYNRKHQRPLWYLMKAHHINDGQQASLQNIIDEQKGSAFTLYVTITEKGTQRFCSSSGLNKDGQQTGKEIKWINDTGMGHRSPAYNDEIMTIQNVIYINCDGVVINRENDVGMDNKRRSTFVFK